MPGAAPPWIVTLTTDEKSFIFFNTLRKQHFPPERNFLDAHLTLFHHLPLHPKVEEDLAKWSRHQSSMVLAVTEVKSIGNGIAYKIDCPELVKLHRIMQKAWQPWLQLQDKQPIWPHITIQNKVPADTAKQTLVWLQNSFKPFTAAGTGFALWSYEGGPWKFIKAFPFIKG